MKKYLLFDFDGVICDTEDLYTGFWGEIGKRYLGSDAFSEKVKGMTLQSLLAGPLRAIPEYHELIVEELNDFERNMPYDYVPGVKEFVEEAEEKGFKTAIVTSSNIAKMESAYSQIPEIRSMFDEILTSEDFNGSKPSPAPYLAAMERFGAGPEECVVFEDSVNGLISGRDSGAMLIGLLTSNTEETVSLYTDKYIPDFQNIKYIFELLSK